MTAAAPTAAFGDIIAKGALEDKNWRSRVAAADALERTAHNHQSTAHTLQLVGPILRHRRWRVRAAAIQVLQRCATPCEDGFEYIKEHLLPREGASPGFSATRQCRLQRHEGNGPGSACGSGGLESYPWAVTNSQQSEFGEVGAYGVERRSSSGPLFRILLRTRQGGPQRPLGSLLQMAQELLMCHSDHGAREAAAELLGQLRDGHEEHRALVRAASQDRCASVRMAACGSAALFCDRGDMSSAEETSSILGSLLDDRNSAVRYEAIRHACTYGNTCLSLSMSRLADGDVRVRRLAAAVLNSMDLQRQGGSLPEPSCVQYPRDWWVWRAAISKTSATSGKLHHCAWAALQEGHCEPAAMGIARTASSNPGGRMLPAMSCLGVGDPLPLDRRIIPQALKGMEASWWRLRRAAAAFLCRVINDGHHDAGMGVIAKLLHPSSRVRLVAIDVLSHLSGTASTQVLQKSTIQLLEQLNDPTAEVRSCTMDAFIRIARNGGFSYDLLGTIVRSIRKSASSNLRHATGNMLVAIAEVPDHGPRISNYLADFLVHALLEVPSCNVDTRNVTVSALAQLAPRGHVGAGVVLQKLAGSDPDSSVRLAALDGLARVICSEDARLREVALLCATDEDEIVCDAAADLLEHLGPYTERRAQELEAGAIGATSAGSCSSGENTKLRSGSSAAESGSDVPDLEHVREEAEWEDEESHGIGGSTCRAPEPLCGGGLQSCLQNT